MKNINTLVEDIYALFDGHHLDPEKLSEFSDGMGLAFKNQFKAYGKERERNLRMSNLGYPLRKLWYHLKGEPGEELRPEAKMKFLYGNILEDMLLLLAAEAGHTVTDMQKEVEIDGVLGHIDGIIDGVLVDVKSASSRSFDKFQLGTLAQDDPFGYLHQLSGYSTGLGGMDGAFLVIDKTLGKICLDRYSAEQLKEYNVRERIANVREAEKSDTPPDRCYNPKADGVTKTALKGNGNYTLAVGCSYCQFKHSCWKEANEGRGLRTFLYSTGPKHFTHVEKEPRVAEIIDGKVVSNNE